ncbi:MAG: hypothetical protein ACD_87C00298G0001, partial [uncultured bacterium]
MFGGDQDRFAGAPDDGLGRGTKDRPAADVEVLAPLGQENPVVGFSLRDDRLVDHPQDLFRFRVHPFRLALLAELLQDRLRLGVEAAFDDREKLLIGWNADGAGDIGEHRSLHETDIDDMEPRQLRIEFPGEIDSISDCRLPVSGAIGGEKDAVDHGPSFFTKKYCAAVMAGWLFRPRTMGRLLLFISYLQGDCNRKSSSRLDAIVKSPYAAQSTGIMRRGVMAVKGWLKKGWAGVIVVFILPGMVFPAPADVSRKSTILATTTSTQDSGLLDVLIPIFEKKTGYFVKTIAVGSGQAMAMGQRGEADVLLVHSPAAEEKFMAEKSGVNRLIVMHNDFV